MTSSYQWQASYSVGNQVLDDQHKQLLQICSEIENLAGNATESPTAGLKATLNDLCTYADEHFRYEEQLLKQLGVPDQENHIREHSQYFTRLWAIIEKSNNGKLNASDLLAFTSNWWVGHILHSDMQYSEYFDKK